MGDRKEEKLAKVMASAAKYEATYGHVFDYVSLHVLWLKLTAASIDYC